MKKRFLIGLIAASVMMLFSCGLNDTVKYSVVNATGKTVYHSTDSLITTCSKNELSQYDSNDWTEEIGVGVDNNLHVYFRLADSSPNDYAELKQTLTVTNQTYVFTLTLDDSGKIVITKTWQ